MTNLNAFLADAELAFGGTNKCVLAAASQNQALKTIWDALGCSIPQTSLNPDPVFLVPQLRVSGKGVTQVPEMILGPRHDL